MRRTISSVWLWLSVLLMLSGTLRAQDLVGDWQGTLVIGQAKLRTILKVSTGPDKKLTAEFYSIDQTSDPFRSTRSLSTGGASSLRCR
jgi:hypothetical protein